MLEDGQFHHPRPQHHPGPCRSGFCRSGRRISSGSYARAGSFNRSGYAINPGRPTRDQSCAALWYGGKSWLDALMPSIAPLRPDSMRARYETLLEVAESIVAHRQLSTLFADLSRRLQRLVSFDFIGLTLVDLTEGT